MRALKYTKDEDRYSNTIKRLHFVINARLLPGIAFAHFTAATTCRPPNMLRVDRMRQLESGRVLSQPEYRTSGSITSSRETRVGVSCGSDAGTMLLFPGVSEASLVPVTLACWIPFIFFFVFRARKVLEVTGQIMESSHTPTKRNKGNATSPCICRSRN